MALPETKQDRLIAMLRAAEGFGLSDDEIWDAVNVVGCGSAAADIPIERFDEVAEALAQKIEEKRGEA